MLAEPKNLSPFIFHNICHVIELLNENYIPVDLSFPDEKQIYFLPRCDVALANGTYNNTIIRISNSRLIVYSYERLSDSDEIYIGTEVKEFYDLSKFISDETIMNIHNELDLRYKKLKKDARMELIERI